MNKSKIYTAIRKLPKVDGVGKAYRWLCEEFENTYEYDEKTPRCLQENFTNREPYAQALVSYLLNRQKEKSRDLEDYLLDTLPSISEHCSWADEAELVEE